MENHYAKLQVDPRAESEVIRAAYHALARKYHPDVGGDARRMTELNEAWAVLGNPLLRSAYDAERDGSNTPPVAAAPADRRGRSDAPPRGIRDSSSVLDFGRYAGWSLEQIVTADPNYLQWLVRTPIGRRLSAEVEALLAVRASLGAFTVKQREPRSGGLFGKRRAREPAGR